MKKLKKLKSLPKGIQKIPLVDLILASWNYKKFNDPVLQKKLVANIKKNGQIENLITYENDKGLLIICNGNHRYLAMQELGFELVDCYHLGKLTDAQAKRIAIETNETKFATDKTKLAILVDEILNTDDFTDFADTNPFDDKEMEKLAAMLKDDELEDDETISDKPQKSKTTVSAGGEAYTLLKLELTPKLADRFNNAVARFNFLEGVEKPVDIMVQMVERFTNEEILEMTGNNLKRKKASTKRLTL